MFLTGLECKDCRDITSFPVLFTLSLAIYFIEEVLPRFFPRSLFGYRRSLKTRYHLLSVNRTKC